MRLIVGIARALRGELPSSMTIGARLSATEWVEGGFDADAAVTVARALKDAGVAYICASSGGNAAQAKVAAARGYQVPFAEKIRREAEIATRAVGLIVEPEQAEAIVAEGRADFVALARAVLADPRWPWRAAASLGEPLHPVDQYARSAGTMLAWAAPRSERRSAA